MAISPNPNPSPNPAPRADNSKQRIIAIAAVVIIALLGLNIFLLVNKSQQTRANTELNSQLDESQQLKAELEKQYYEALSELEEMRGSNEELNTLIEQQKGELKKSKDQIVVLLRDKNNLSAARKKMAELGTQVDQYVAQINQLRAENEQLASANTTLSYERDSLNTSLSTERATNQELSTAKAALVTEKEALEQERTVLSSKVNKASVIKVRDFNVNGLQTRGNGKMARKKYAKNVDQIEVCFNILANEVAEEGTEKFYLRIINPQGETLAIEELGSGVINSLDSGEEVRFTQVKELNYDRSASEMCMIWAPSQPFQEGAYTVEVYNKGHLAGTTTFELK